MAAQPGATAVTPGRTTPDVQKLYQEGMIAGIIGAAVIAVWFLLLDTIAGRPFYTPTVLGTALFRRGAGLASPETLAVSMEMVLMFTWVHGLVFAGFGGAASYLLGVAERHPSVAFGILLLFVVFQFGFTVVVMLFATPVLTALGWPAILVANLLAAGAMAAYFWLRHPRLRVNP